MKLNRRIMMVSTVALALILAVAFSVQARPFGRGKHGGGFGRHGGMGMKGGMGGLGHLVDLSDEQRAAMEEISAEYRPQMRALREKMHASRESVREQMEEGDYEGAFNTGSAIRKEMFLLRAEMMKKVDGLLTDEQRAEIDTRRSERHARMEGRFGDRANCLDQ